MAFYMITYGRSEITEAYVGQTEQDTVANARGLIDKWPEYTGMDDREIVDMLREDEMCEFDMVQIQAEWKGSELPLKVMVELYDNQKVPARIYTA
ncbi:hypothetical protein [Sansalvadorimonas verongulae]|uniref:hypothetical protein n=1 Tax=Sansalvadorimonas verongulae TaxID=2172824 RepID=UPI0012BB5B9B|nr:hypothetical protein [Sansalvadorimonas verongulae]MTI12174.1 hypothetical protein [Sansalvadorimonas verongulae]